MEMKNYYQVLGVDKNAPPADIKKAYRKLARQYHPDVSKESDADARMKEINEAYSVLSDAEKRAAYDDMSAHPASAGRYPGAGGWDGAYDHGDADLGDVSDFFANLFGKAGRVERGAAFQMRGQDRHASIVIDLADAYHGAERTMALRLPQVDVHGQVVTEERTLKVKIPKGVKEGQHMRLAGQGSPGSGGAPSGDLYLEVHFQPNSQYRVEGKDVYEKLPVAPWEAAIGAAITVPTPVGKVQVNVPPGSQAGRKLRLKGRGIPGQPAGDLYLVLEVVVPPATTDKERALYETMAREMAFDPRQEMGV
jgi:curved DNA-binding protein